MTGDGPVRRFVRSADGEVKGTDAPRDNDGRFFAEASKVEIPVVTIRNDGTVVGNGEVE